ncbi:phosphate ABC transporter permease subunit PstC [Caldithrix abyssi]|uniref:Phosphate transport system permease protein n=1 Tax=Caldithrix abyssi DSM 13497 TaxID=880073 RepID=H1XRY6_CALAY|nr:phosphate ABC transporter permease subunit PstC [Caldithrix abyssi]EHO42479.1 phosphate ABC transporter, inner membrane subunit PstC [Caldithrix abyssi DSM 13497]
MKLLLERSTQSRSDGVFRLLTILGGALILLIMALLFIELVSNSWLSIEKFGLRFFYTNIWDPVQQEFGALSSLYGTLISTLIAMIIAVPLSLVIALFLVEMAPPPISKFFGMAIELLAAIPSIIYGMWGLFVFAPLMARYIQPFLQKVSGNFFLFEGPPMGIGMLTAGIILAIMILPFISSVMREVFLMVPSVVKESAVGMGATTWEMVKVMIRYGVQGMIGATFIGLGRAIGETMAVTFVIGNSHVISTSLFAPSNSITATLANEFAEASEPLYLSALIELGLLLFLVTFLIQMISQLWLKRIQKTMGVQ